MGLHDLPPFHPKTGALNVVIETPKGSRNKYSFDHELGVFKLKKVLPLGASFPFDFGFVPSTIADDGDPLDVLLIMDEPAFAGCLVRARLLGNIEARQKGPKDKKAVRNDRLVAIAEKNLTHCEVKSLSDLDDEIVQQIEHFFISYNQMEGKQFKVVGRSTSTEARKLIEAGHDKFRDQEQA